MVDWLAPHTENGVPVREIDLLIWLKERRERMFSFSSSKLVDRPFDWAYQLEDLGYSGWEIVNEGQQKLTRENLAEAKQIVETTNLTITIHLPYSDLNLASVNQPIWEETVRQMKSCLDLANDFARLAVVHPGHFSPLGMQMPDAAWLQSIAGSSRSAIMPPNLDMRIAVENMVNMPAILGRQARGDSRNTGDCRPRERGLYL